MKSLLAGVFTFLVVVVAQIRCALPIEKLCGELKCQDHEYCAQIDHVCRPCSSACEPQSSNYDHRRCEEGCQDFIHDRIYLRRNESSTNNGDYVTRQDLESVKHILYYLIVVTTLILILGVSFLCSRHLSQCCLLRSQHKKKQKIVLPIIYDNKYGKEKESMENKDNNNKRRSIRLEREPSESTLPEYAYDNPNMSHSPVHHV